MMIKLLIMMYCKFTTKKLPLCNEVTFFSKNDYAISFKNLLDLKNRNWQNINVQIFKCHKNGIVNGVAFYPKQTNSFMQVNPVNKYFYCFRKILNGEIKNEIPSKKEIKAFKKAIWWFPFKVNLENIFDE